MAAFVIECWSSPTLKMATPRTPTGIFCESTPSTSRIALSAFIERYCAFCTTGTTSAPPPVTILYVRPSVPAAAFTPAPVMISAWSAAGTRYSALNSAASSTRPMTTAAATMMVGLMAGLRLPRMGGRWCARDAGG